MFSMGTENTFNYIRWETRIDQTISRSIEYPILLAFTWSKSEQLLQARFWVDFYRWYFLNEQDRYLWVLLSSFRMDFFSLILIWSRTYSFDIKQLELERIRIYVICVFKNKNSSDDSLLLSLIINIWRS